MRSLGRDGQQRNEAKCEDLMYADRFELAFQESWESLCRKFQSGNQQSCGHPVAKPISRATVWQERPFPQFASTSLSSVPAFKSDLQNANGNLGTEQPSFNQLLQHPLALFSYVPKGAALFIAGAIAGATARTITAPLDRIKLLMQVHSVRTSQGSANAGIGFLEAALKIAKEEGWRGYWKGNLPQVLRLIPYSAIQLTSYELYKNLFQGEDPELSVVNRLAAGACAGMTSTLVTYPLDVLRLRLAVDPASKSLIQVATTMLREEGLSSFYGGLGPSLLGIAPYIALNFCVFDLIKKSIPEEFRKTPAASFFTAIVSSSLATTSCYPLDTIRRQMQMKGTPYKSVFEAFSGIIAKEGFIGLYRGFVPNALKSLPNSSIRLTTFDTAKSIYTASELEFQRLIKERQGRAQMTASILSYQYPSSRKLFPPNHFLVSK